MKKTFLLIIAFMTITLHASSQVFYNEVKSIMDKNYAIKFDKSKPLNERKIATFKYDAMYYLILQGSKNETFTERDLAEQTSAMIDYVASLINQLSKYTKRSQREAVIAQYRRISLENSLFQDMDKDVIYGYVDNNDFITQFSLDTNWVKALSEIEKVYKK